MEIRICSGKYCKSGKRNAVDFMFKQVHIVVLGRVQGVFFRAHTQKKALELHLTGWVKNTDNDGVEIVAQGEEKALSEFLEWCKKGPDSAQVKNVSTNWSETEEKFSGFEIVS